MQKISRLWPALFLLIAAATLHPAISSGVALIAGIALALSFGNPCHSHTRRWTPLLLQISVVGLGAGVDLGVVVRVGLHGVGYTAAGIALTLALGSALGAMLGVGSRSSLLVSSGTAICGGGAIAAVAPVLQAKPAEVAVALATVFFLNASALFIFPGVGHAFGLDQLQFGLWSALAIHDTSSVVGASLQYGHEALETATTVKLARALWIVPLAFGIGWLRPRSGKVAVRKPWFILGFVLISAVVTWIPALQPLGENVALVARRCLVLTLFLIGANLTRETLRDVGLKPFLQGLLLWIFVGVGSLAAIRAGWVQL